MKYVPFIFENESVRSNVASKEALVNLATDAIIKHNVAVENQVFSNLGYFINQCQSIDDVYGKIRDYVVNENITAFSQVSEILSDTELTDEDKVLCLEFDPLSSFQSFADRYQQNEKAGMGPLGSVQNAMKGKTPIHHGMPQEVTQKLVDKTGTVDDAISKTQSKVADGQIAKSDLVQQIKTKATEAAQFAQAHPWAVGGAAAAGLGAYGAYRYMKSRKAEKA